jgi:membrane-associated phospholipid phosphatase
VSRVYLGASYLSDAVGGVALGTAIWALAGSVALVVSYVRHNGDRSA